MRFCGGGWGETGAPARRSGKTDPLMSRENWFPICGGPMTAGGHMDVVAAAEVTAGWLEPSSIASLMPLWLVVLMAEGEDPSTAVSLGPLNEMRWAKPPASHSRSSKLGWPPDMSWRPSEKGDVGSRAMDCGDSA